MVIEELSAGYDFTIKDLKMKGYLDILCGRMIYGYRIGY